MTDVPGTPGYYAGFGQGDAGELAARSQAASSAAARLDAARAVILDQHSRPRHQNGASASSPTPASVAAPVPKDDPEEALTLKAAMRARHLTSAALAALPAPSWLVDGVVPAGGLTTLYGPSGAGKSFVAIDLAAHVATGRPWHGHDVAAGPVLYVIAEGRTGAGQRLTAWADSTGISLDDLPITWDPGPLNLHTGFDSVCLWSIAKDDRYALVVIDTLARTTVGAEENSAKDMGIIVAACASVADTGAAVLIVHHTGKDIERGARGSNALRGAVDAELEVAGAKGRLTVRIRKQKDAVEGPPISLRLTPHGDSAVLQADEKTAGRFRPTTLMERVSDTLSGAIDGLSKNDIRRQTTGKNEAIDTALEVLVDEGYVADDAAAGGRRYRLQAPYVAAADPASDSYTPALEQLLAEQMDAV